MTKMSKDFGQWEGVDDVVQTPPESTERQSSRGSSNSSRGSKRSGKLPRAINSSDAENSSPKAHRKARGKEMKIDLSGLAARLNGLAATGSSEDGSVPSGLDNPLESSSVSARGGVSLAGGSSFSLGRHSSQDSQSSRGAKQSTDRFSAGASFREKVLARKKLKAAGAAGGKGNWSIIAQLESGSFADRQRGESPRNHYSHVRLLFSTVLGVPFEFQPCQWCRLCSGSVAEARASARAVAASGMDNSVEPPPRATPRGSVPPLSDSRAAGNSADNVLGGQPRQGIQSSSFVSWGPKGGPLGGRRERSRLAAHSGRVR